MISVSPLDILGRCDQWIKPPSVADAPTFFVDENPYGYALSSDAYWMVSYLYLVSKHENCTLGSHRVPILNMISYV